MRHIKRLVLRFHDIGHWTLDIGHWTLDIVEPPTFSSKFTIVGDCNAIDSTAWNRSYHTTEFANLFTTKQQHKFGVYKTLLSLFSAFLRWGLFKICQNWLHPSQFQQLKTEKIVGKQFMILQKQKTNNFALFGVSFHR